MLDIKPIRLLSGHHKETAQTGQGCFMNVVAYLNGEQTITDASDCVCVTVRKIAIHLNDVATDEQRQRLLPFVLRALGSATKDPAIMRDRLQKVVDYARANAAAAAAAAAYANAANANAAAAYANAANANAAANAAYANAVANAAAAADADAAYAYAAAHAAAESQEELFQLGLDFLDAVLPPLVEPPQAVQERAAKLVKLNEEAKA